MNIFQFMSDSPVVTVLLAALIVILVVHVVSAITNRNKPTVNCSHDNEDDKFWEEDDDWDDEETNPGTQPVDRKLFAGRKEC